MDIIVFIFEQILSRGLGVFFVVFSCVVAYYLVRGFRLGRASIGWEKVKGFVTCSEIEIWDSGKSYYPKIDYQYRVGNQDYEGKEWSHSAITSRKAVVEEIIARYEVGRKINVYYNPLKPEQAVLEPGINSVFPYAFGFLLTAFFFLIGILNIFRFWPFNDIISQ